MSQREYICCGSAPDLQMKRQSSSCSWWQAGLQPLQLVFALSLCPSASCWLFLLWSGTYSFSSFSLLISKILKTTWSWVWTFWYFIVQCSTEIKSCRLYAALQSRSSWWSCGSAGWSKRRNTLRGKDKLFINVDNNMHCVTRFLIAFSTFCNLEKGLSL